MGGSAGGRCRIIFSHKMQCEIDNLMELVSVGLLLGHEIEPKYFLRPPKSDSFNFVLLKKALQRHIFINVSP